MSVVEVDWLAQRFEAHRMHLRSVAYRMLGSLSEADDAVQEAWLRLSRSDPDGIQNLGGWLTTVVARVCLDFLRSRESRREDPLDLHRPALGETRQDGGDPEEEALLADSVGVALLVVLETLTPAERLAFVLHDLFAVSFEEIAPLVGRSPTAARQLASRARRRVHGVAPQSSADRTHQREVVNAFLAAARGGDFGALLAVLDPEVAFRADPTAVRLGAVADVCGAAAVAELAIAAGARGARHALVNGEVGLVVAPRGRLRMVMRLTVAEGKIVAIEMTADPNRLRQLELAVLSD
jgi:RNA polymerase sigma factor (sigma-70 family)